MVGQMVIDLYCTRR